MNHFQVKLPRLKIIARAEFIRVSIRLVQLLSEVRVRTERLPGDEPRSGEASIRLFPLLVQAILK